MASRADDVQTVLRVLSRFPAGATLAELASHIKPPIAERTLQRRLHELRAERRVVVEGKGRATRYRLAPAVGRLAATTDDVSAEIRVEAGVPLSSAGAELKRSVQRPLTEREPVGYYREWLEAYRPGHTWYLPEKTRERLHEQGRSSDEELPAGTYVKEVYQRLLIDLSWNSSRLEGNTYSLLETERLLAIGQVAEGKDAAAAQMILNHKAAIELLVDTAGEIGFSRYSILNLHALLSENLLPDPTAGGRLRRIVVGISQSTFEPLAVPQLIEECFDTVLSKATAIPDPFEQALFVMVHLPYLQPFEDVNKRVSRLAANIPLITENLSPLSFVDVPARDYLDGILAVYELRRVELLRDVFVWAYERSCARYGAVRRSLGQPDPFRLRHRDRIHDVVAAVVRAPLDKTSATHFVQSRASELPETELPASERARFVETVETELLSLHEGNFARYRVTPAEFERWNRQWSTP